MDTMSVASSEFQVSERGQLLDMYGEPHPIAVGLRLPALDHYHRKYIENSPLIIIATASLDCEPAVSPKGDDPGFVKILDDSTLLIPDRPGNNQIRGLKNLIDNPKIALFFMVPGVNEILRVEGAAELTTDPEVLKPLEARGKIPTTAIVIRVTLAYFHCGKALLRSDVWNPDKRVPEGTVPTLGEAMVYQLKMNESSEEANGLLHEEYGANL